MAVGRFSLPGQRANNASFGGKMILGGDEGYTFGGYRIVVFTKTGPIRVQGTVTVEYLMVGGGGSGAGGAATRGYGGGGGGGYLTGTTTLSSMVGNVTVGLGGRVVELNAGSDVASWGRVGTDSYLPLNLLRAYGGGYGATGSNNGGPGGSGGGAGDGATATSGGAPVAGQGYAGGNAPGSGSAGGNGGGGGGGGGAGSGYTRGAAATNSILGYSDTFCGGGEGGYTNSEHADAAKPLKANRGHGSYCRGGSNTQRSLPGSDGLVVLRYVV